MRHLADEILCLAGKKDKLEIVEIQDKLKMPRETLNIVMDFLIRFGLAQLDTDKICVSLSEPCKKFFEEEK